MAVILESLVHRIRSLPTLPTVFSRVTQAVSDPRTSALDLSRLIMEDQALTGWLLRLVNSPFYGFSRRIATVTQAVAILGFNPIRNLLLTSSVVHLLSPEETGELSRVKLWEHSVGTAVAAGLIARYTRHDDREELFVAGLLHDVGKLLEFRFLRPQFLEVLRLSHAEDIPIREAELRVLGFSHDQVGRVLGERWKLPLRLTETIAFHHHPDGAPSAPREAAIIHLADILSRALSLGSGGDDAVPPLDREAWDRVGLPLAVLEPLMDEIEAQYEYAVRSLMASSDKAAGPGQSGNRVQVG